MASSQIVFRCPEQQLGVHRAGRRLSGAVSSVERVGALDLIHELGNGSYGQIYTAVQNFGQDGQATVGRYLLGVVLARLQEIHCSCQVHGQGVVAELQRWKLQRESRLIQDLI